MEALVIALLEDHKQAQEIKSCLNAAGHTVILAENFKNAKVALLENRCDLILSDVHLQNGGTIFDFLRWVRSNPTLKPIPFVLLSIEPTEMASYLSDGVRVAARVFGATKYVSLAKFDPVELMAHLAEFLPSSEGSPTSVAGEVV